MAADNPGETGDRRIDRVYRDPLDELWLATAARIGVRVVRSDAAFASSDGRGTVEIASPAHLDADDCLAQMIFHELCHSLVAGRDSFELTDWGLEPSGRDITAEHACLRAQAHLAARHGLRQVLAPTTDFRAFYDALGHDPLEPRATPSSALAIAAIGRANRSPWAPHLDAALAATAAIAASGADLWASDSLLGARTEPPPRHLSGLAGGWVAGRACGQCGYRLGSGRCAVAGVEVEARESACEHFEANIDCATCGACCREGYDSVTIEPGDPVAIAHPELVVDRTSYLELARDGSRCAALRGGPTEFACSIYGDRPRCCRELERGGEHCLTARRRVGLSI